MTLFLPRRNLLAYPAGIRPGFDPSHVAAQNSLFSFVASGNRLRNLQTGQSASAFNAGTITAPTRSSIGPVVNFDSSGALVYNISGTTVIPNLAKFVTMAAIVRPTNISGGFVSIFTINNDDIGPGADWGLWLYNTNELALRCGAATLKFTGVTIVQGAPYFFGISSGDTNNGFLANFVIRRLDTGQVWSTSLSPTGANTTNLYVSSVTINARYNTAQPPSVLTEIGDVAALMMNANYLSMQQMLQWADDPWSFWYPAQKTRSQYQSYPQPNFVGGALTKTRMRPKRNLLTYPVGEAAGFDPTHFAARGAAFSGVALGAGGDLVNILSGKQGSITGTPTAGVLSSLGPATKLTGTTDLLQFSSMPAVTPSAILFQAIVQFSAVGAAQQNIMNTGGGVSNHFLLNTGQVGTWNGTYTLTTTGPFAPVVGVPYYIAVSQMAFAGGSNTNFVIVNLLTGKVNTEVVFANTNPLGADSSTLFIGNNVSGNQINGSIAAIAYSNVYASIQQLQQMAADPWSFWYPRNNVIRLRPADKIIGGARVQQRYNQNKLPYPAGRVAGFDPTHVGASGGGTTYSVVSSQGAPSGITPFSLVGQPSQWTPTGSPAAKIDGSIGPAIYSASGNNSYLESDSIVTSASLTYGVIFKCDVANVSWNTLLGAAGASLFFTDAGGGNTPWLITPTASITGITLFPGIPYFLAVSILSAATINAVATNLLTGQIQSTTLAFSGTLLAGTGVQIGGSNTQGGIAAVMVGRNKYLSLAQLQQWALDPWSFWYPNNKVTKLALTEAAAIVPSGGSIIPQLIAAASAAAVTMVKTIGKVVAVTSTGAMSVIKSIGKKLAITSISAVAFLKTVGKTILVSCTSSTAWTALKVKLVTVSAACSGAVSVIKSVGKNIAVTSLTATSWLKSCGKIVAATGSGAVSFLKTITKTVLATCAGAVTASAIKVKIVIVSVASSGAVSVKRAVNKTVSVASSGVVSMVKAITHAISVMSSTVTAFVKVIGKTVLVVSAGFVSVVAAFHAGGSGFVYQVAVNVMASTFTQWLARFIKKAGPESTARSAVTEISPRNSGWPAAPRE